MNLKPSTNLFLFPTEEGQLGATSQSRYTVNPLHIKFRDFKDEKLPLYVSYCIIVLFKIL